jgi:hypothetical protein
LAVLTAPILILYAIGNGFLGFAGFPFYLQYAKGNLRLHLMGNVIFVIFLLPSIIFASNNYGAVGAGFAWLLMNILTLLIWVPIVHNKLLPGINSKWFAQDIFLIIAPMIAAGVASKFFYPSNLERINALIYLSLATLLVLLCGAISSSYARNFIAHRWIAK